MTPVLLDLMYFSCLVILEKTIRIPRSLSVKAATVLKGVPKQGIAFTVHLSHFHFGAKFE